MANIVKRISGKLGRIFLQVGTTAVVGPTSATGNSGAEVVDGISYDAYQVWTVAGAPFDPNTPPTVTVGGSGLPTAYTYDIDYLRGKLIFTPTLGASATVSISNYATPKLYAIGDSVDFSLDVAQADIDTSVQGKTWETSDAGQSKWSGSATIAYRHDQSTGNSWWLAGAGASVQNPVVLKFFPAIGKTEYWLGAARIDWGIKVDKGSMIVQSVKFKGDGSLIFAAS
ncbi:MAG: hypothetical protein ACE15D_18700 [Candidatus Eisenbacteria bacterium]